MKKNIAACLALLLVASVCNQAAADALNTTSSAQTPSPIAVDINSSRAKDIRTSSVTDSPTSDLPSTGNDYKPIITFMNVGVYKGWKSSDRFDFSYVDGVQEIYNPEEQILISVEGKSDKLFVEQGNGFDVAATIIDLSRKVGKCADVKYDSNRRVWQIKATAPKDRDREYKILLNLFCKKHQSSCAETYGLGAQVDKIFTFKIL